MENQVETNVETTVETPLSAENVTAFIQENPSVLKNVLGQDFAKPIVQPMLDSHFSKSLETWKGNNLDGLVEAKVAELYPEESPESKQLRQLQQQINQMQAEKRMSELEVVKRDVLTEQGLHTSFSKFVIGDSEDSILANAVELKNLLAGQVQSGVEARFKKEAHTPQTPTDVKDTTANDLEAFRKMSVTEKTKFKQTNPAQYEQFAEAILNG